MIPPGFCQCGCGGKTAIAKKNDRSRAMVKGEPRRFLPSHNAKVTNHPWRVLSETDYVVTDRGYTSPCWVWRGKTRVGAGYTRVGFGGRYLPAHRAYYEHYVGPVPAGMELDHLCRVTDCVNPSHLEPVTHTENVRRGRATKIPDAVVQAIRDAEGTSVDIARRFGVSQAHAYDIRKGIARP